jgi:hypothetical protein
MSLANLMTDTKTQSELVATLLEILENPDMVAAIMSIAEDKHEAVRLYRAAVRLRLLGLTAVT